MNRSDDVNQQQLFGSAFQNLIVRVYQHKNLALVGIFVFFIAAFLVIFAFQTNSAKAAITYVGGTTGSGTGSTYAVSLSGLTGGSGSSPQENDIVIVVTGWASTANGDPGVTTAGYNEITDVVAATETRMINMSVNWKRMSSSPDSSVTVRGFNNAANGGATVVHVWRGVDTTTAIDAGPLTSGSGINGNNADPPAITPTTSGAVIIAALMGTTDTTPQAKTGPSGMSNFRTVSGTGSTMSSIAGIASFDWTSGSYDPAAWSGGGNLELRFPLCSDFCAQTRTSGNLRFSQTKQ